MRKKVVLLVLVIVPLIAGVAGEDVGERPVCVETPDLGVVDREGDDSLLNLPNGAGQYGELVIQAPDFPRLVNHIPFDVLIALCLAQLFAESTFRHDAISPVGARGIAQFRDATWRAWGQGNPFNPKDAINAQIRYMGFLYSRFEEIPNQLERYKFALASYNIGRSRVNAALSRARRGCGHPAGLSAWEAAGAPNGSWQNWEYTSRVLWEMYPYADETVEYVKRVFDVASSYVQEGVGE